MSLPDSNSFNSLGGELQDYAPVTDPTTDLSAEASNEMRCDVAAMTRTATRAIVKFTVSGGAVTIANTDFEAVYGNSLTYKPSGVVNGNGDYTITFPATVNDARGIEHDVNFKYCWANYDGPITDFYVARAKILSPNTVQVFLQDMVAPAATPPSSTSAYITLFVI